MISVVAAFIYFLVITVGVWAIVSIIAIIAGLAPLISKRVEERRLAERLQRIQRDQELNRQINRRLVEMTRYWEELFEQQMRNQREHLDHFHARYFNHNLWDQIMEADARNKSGKVCWQKEGF